MQEKQPVQVDIVVTKQPEFAKWLKRKGHITEDTPICHFATKEQIAGKNVFGELPLEIAVLARSVTKIRLNLPDSLRGKRLSEKEVEAYCTGMDTYWIFNESSKLTNEKLGDLGI